MKVSWSFQDPHVSDLQSFLSFLSVSYEFPRSTMLACRSQHGGMAL